MSRAGSNSFRLLVDGERGISMSHRKIHSRHRATSQPPKGSGRHRRERTQSPRHAAGTVLTRAVDSPRLPGFDVRTCRPGPGGQHRRRSAHRSYVTTGVAIVGASAVVGTAIAPPAAENETSRVRLTYAESVPNPLLAAIIETSGEARPGSRRLARRSPSRRSPPLSRKRSAPVSTCGREPSVWGRPRLPVSRSRRP